MIKEDVNNLKSVLSKIEKKLMIELFHHVDGDVSEFITGPDIYAIGDKLGLSKDEVYRYSISLGKRGLLKTEPVLGGEIAAVRLTVDGADFVILTR